MSAKKVHWEPQPRQRDALVRPEFEILFGGSRGGGKTDAGQAWLLYDKDDPLYRFLVIRKNSDDLKDWADRAQRMYKPTKAEFSGVPTEIRFPSGAIGRTGHLKDANAYMKYQGHEYQKMLIEELTQIPTEENYLKLIASCRSTHPQLRPQVFATANPDGPGFTWVRRRWGLKGIPTKTIITRDPMTGLYRVFIPSRLQDNKYLLADPQYKAFLDGLPDGLREAWRDGSWDDPIIKGAYYTAELNQARREGRLKFQPIDPLYPVYVVFDLGISDSMALGFFQRYDNKVYLVHSYANEGFGLPHYAAYIQEFQRNNQIRYGKFFAPFDIKVRELSTGQTRQQEAKKLGLNFNIVPSLNIADGISKVRLMFPRLYISEPQNEQLLNAIRQYRKQWDDPSGIYQDKPVHDWTSHFADMLRYAALVEGQMKVDDGVIELPQKFERISDFEPNYDDDEEVPMKDGIRIGQMGHGPVKHDDD